MIILSLFLDYIFWIILQPLLLGWRSAFIMANGMLKSPLISVNFTLFYSFRIKDLCNDAIYMFAYYYSSVIFWSCQPLTTSFLREAEAWTILCSYKCGNVGGQTKERHSVSAPLKAEKLKHKFKSHQKSEKPHGWAPRSNDLTVGSISAGLHTLRDVRCVPQPRVHFHVHSLVSNKGVSSHYSIRT